MNSSAALRDTTRSRTLLALLLLVGTLALWSPVRHFAFLNLDDNLYVTENPFVRSGLSSESVRWVWGHFYSGHWHPLTLLSHMLDVEWFGLDARAHHVTNALIHSVSALLLFFFLLTTTGERGASFLVAALFAVHPLRLESVAWVSERKDVLSTFFGMLTLLAYARYVRTGTVLRYALVGACYALSLMSKPTLVTLPLLLVLVDRWPFGRRALWEKLPLLGLALTFSCLAVLAQREGGGLRALGEISLASRFAMSAVAYVVYLGKFFYPGRPAIFYPAVTYSLGVSLAAAFTLAIALIASSRLSRNGRPWIIVGLGWFFLSLLPMVGLVTIGAQAYADRWTYWPHIGLAIAVVWSLKDLPSLMASPNRAWWCGTIVVVLAASITYRELPNWKDDYAVFHHALAVTKGNYLAHTNLGEALDRAGDLVGAAPHYEEAARLSPRYPEALNNLGTLRARQGRLEEAEALFGSALALRPHFPKARQNLELARRKRIASRE